MEVWDLYDSQRRLTLLRHIRGAVIPEGCYHLVVHVWLRNRKGEYLISQRSADRPSFPLMWECVGGSVLKGESSLEGAIRETREQVGIELRPERGRRVFSRVREEVNGQRFADILDVWLFDYDGPAFLERASTREVADTAWLNREEIKQLLDKGKFVDTLAYFFADVDGKEPYGI